ncbi:MAG: hypothetical protein WDO68_00315 [Gammaproteobacteria bacterium]
MALGAITAAYVLIANATIDEEGRVTYVQIVEQEPADESYGFGEAAATYAKTIRFTNPQHQSTQVMFRVKFALADKHGDATAPSAAQTAAEAHLPAGIPPR